MFQTPTTTSSKVIALLSAQTQWPLAFVPAATGIARTPLGPIYFELGPHPKTQLWFWTNAEN
jgi:hypothetical protein